MKNPGEMPPAPIDPLSALDDLKFPAPNAETTPPDPTNFADTEAAVDAIARVISESGNSTTQKPPASENGHGPRKAIGIQMGSTEDLPSIDPAPVEAVDPTTPPIDIPFFTEEEALAAANEAGAPPLPTPPGPAVPPPLPVNPPEATPVPPTTSSVPPVPPTGQPRTPSRINPLPIPEISVDSKSTGIFRTILRDVGDYVKLGSVDKWKMMMDRSSEESILNRGRNELAGLNKRKADLTNKMQYEMSKHDGNIALARSILDGISDPSLRATTEARLKIFEDSKKMVADAYRGPLGAFDTKINQASTKVESAKNRIEGIEKFAYNKIENKLNEQKERYGYEDLISARGVAERSISEARRTLGESEARMMQIKIILDSKQIYSKEDIKICKLQHDSLVDELKKNKKALAQAEKSKLKVSSKIINLETGFQDWEVLKGQYGFEVIDEKGVRKDGRSSAAAAPVSARVPSVRVPVAAAETGEVVQEADPLVEDDEDVDEEGDPETAEERAQLKHMNVSFDKLLKVAGKAPLDREGVYKVFDEVNKVLKEMDVTDKKGEPEMKKIFEKVRRSEQDFHDSSNDRAGARVSKDVKNIMRDIKKYSESLE